MPCAAGALGTFVGGTGEGFPSARGEICESDGYDGHVSKSEVHESDLHKWHLRWQHLQTYWLHQVMITRASPDSGVAPWPGGAPQ